MKIILNGKEKKYKAAVTLDKVVCAACGKNALVVTEVNEHIVKKEARKKTILKNGDVVEVISFLGGG